MDDQPGLSDQYRMASPWPVFVALGLAISEVGILFGIIPIAVGGLLLLVGCIAGIIQEAGYTQQPWGVLGILGLVLVVLGGILVATQVPSISVSAVQATMMDVFSSRPNGIVLRGVSIVFSGAIALVVSQAAQFVEHDADAI